MKTFANILVGIDFSKASRRALKQAERIARREKSTIVAFHAVTPLEIEDYQRHSRRSRGEIVGRLLAGLEDLVAEELGSRDAAKCEVSVGRPHQELNHRAKATDFDLIILGSRGTSVDPKEVGSFAARCVRHAEVPVLLTGEDGDAPFRSIVACIDFSPVTREVIENAAKIALDEQAELHVVHSSYPPWMRPTHVLYNLELAEDEDFRANYRELLRDQLDAAIREASQFLPIQIHRHLLEHPNLNRSLVGFLKDHQADLAIVGHRGGVGQEVKQLLLGSTAERLIHQCPCSVLAVPPKSAP